MGINHVNSQMRRLANNAAISRVQEAVRQPALEAAEELMLPVPVQVPEQLQLLAQQNIQAMQVQNPLNARNPQMAFIDETIRQYGPLPENVEQAPSYMTYQMSQFLNTPHISQLSGFLNTMRNFVRHNRILMCQYLNAKPEPKPGEHEFVRIGNQVMEIDDGYHFTKYNIDVYNEISLDKERNTLKYIAVSPEKFKSIIEFDLNDRNNLQIKNKNLKYSKTKSFKEMRILDNSGMWVMFMKKHKMYKEFIDVKKAQNLHPTTQNMYFRSINGQDKLIKHIVFDRAQELLEYDVLTNTLKTENAKIDLNVVDRYSDDPLKKVVIGNIGNKIGNNRGYVLNYNGVDLNIPKDRVNTSGTLKALMNQHREVLEALNRNYDRPVIVLASTGDIITPRDGQWGNGYNCFDRDNHLKYVYQKGVNEQDENQIVTYHEGSDQPAFNIITKSKLRNIDSATYRYAEYDANGQVVVDNETIVNNDVLYTIMPEIEQNLEQLAGKEERKVATFLTRAYEQICEPNDVLRQFNWL